MKVVRRGLVVGALCGLAASVAFGALGACSNDGSENVAAGGECFSASDCAPGLICIAVKNSDSRVCSSDLTGITGNPEDMPDSTMREATVLESGAFDGPDLDTSMPTDAADTAPADAGADG